MAAFVSCGSRPTLKAHGLSCSTAVTPNTRCAVSATERRDRAAPNSGSARPGDALDSLENVFDVPGSCPRIHDD